ncbi:MAG TPA: amidohydrolase family protein [Anaeromyxobacteraceae bacterium]|nr:amidohydrolase family protein [Anaeromyxobacteraceae bacterium]
MSDPLLIGPDRSGRTVAVTGGRVAASPAPGARSLACPAGEIAPGAVCAHTHLYSGLALYGMPSPVPPPGTFLEILGRVWWRLDRALDRGSLRASARDAVARALLAGTTTLVDHHESPNLIEGSLELLSQACEELGVRALLCYGATERNFGADEARRGLGECRRVPRSPLLRGLVGLHASFTVSDETLEQAGRLARELGTAVHVHVAEALSDVEDARARGARGPLERMLARDALPRGSILAHGVHLDRDEVELAESHGLWLVQNPRSNEGNRVGYPKALGYARRVALGTDGWEADMAVEEAALLRLAAAARDGHAKGRLAAGHGLASEAFGATPEPLAPGALGDVVVREGGRVRHVVVDGRVVVRDGRLAAADFSEIEDASRREASRLWERMARIP